MWAEQAIFTSLSRNGQAGYHVVSRSPGVSGANVRDLAMWSPSHGALIRDASNRVSVNIHSLADGRHVLSRTCEGPPEYSGRGGRQLYTHALILEHPDYERVGGRPIALYRHALALGYLHYRIDPPQILDPVRLSEPYTTHDADHWKARAGELGVDEVETIRAELTTGGRIEMRHAGDRIILAECLFGILPPEVAASVSVSTSLQPSPSRPFRLCLHG